MNKASFILHKPCLLIFLLLVFYFPLLINAQEIILQHPQSVVKASNFDITPPLRDMQIIKPGSVKRDFNEAEEDKAVPNQKSQRYSNQVNANPLPIGRDPALQKYYNNGKSLHNTPQTLLNIEGLASVAGFYPPDTQGDVGDDDYVQITNCSFAVYRKSDGARLYGPADNNTIWKGFSGPGASSNNGDGVVLYDEHAKRWLFSQFALPNFPNGPFYEMIAISETSDPLGAWYRYSFKFDDMPDYPKLGVWSDGYYLSVNSYSSGTLDWLGGSAAVFERDSMLAGRPNARMIFFAPGRLRGDMLPTDWDGPLEPPAGSPDYFIYLNDDSQGFPYDQLKILEFHADWKNINNAIFTSKSTLKTAPFNSTICNNSEGACVPQPNTTVLLQALSEKMMYRLQYRNFGNYQAIVANHTINPDNNNISGIRWYELRNTGSGWSIYQQGTYAPPDNLYRWMGSIAMNKNGDIALGYSVSGSTVFPSIRYTGRYATDPPGVMTVPETEIIAGSGSQIGTGARWGDYSMMSVDPSDDKTFWYTQEYVKFTGNTSWRTRIASIQLKSDYSISGSLTYDNIKHSPLNNTLINLDNNQKSESDTNTTDVNGNFVFNNLINSSYFLKPQITKDWGGVNPADALIVNRYYIGMYDFTDDLYKRAADVNNDSKIDPVDALLINRRYIQTLKSFPAGDWLYDNDTTILNGNDVAKSVRAVCYGDVNGSYNFNTSAPSTLSLINNDNINLSQSWLIDLPVTVTSDITLGSLGIKLKLKSSQYKVTDIISDIEGLIYNIYEGGVNIAWAMTKDPLILKANQKIFTIKLTANYFTNEPLTVQQIFLDEGSLLTDAYAQEINGISLSIPEITFDVSLNNSDLIHSCHPNPFNQQTTIYYQLPDDCQVNLSIYDLLGKEVANLVNEPLSKGNHQTIFDSKNLQHGIYFYRILAGDKAATGKIILIK